ncbi:MAG: nucleotidyltransferase domain-containing protein [Promethearchaeota archaeon]|nr:MAG: nucleotidyltransferase domain-containing protein [Candidatus Lokiarchaeota archaeon]
MAAKERIKEIYNDFLYIIEKRKIIGILLYGSLAKDQETIKSDVDICIVAPDEDNFELLSFIVGNINVVKKKYDIRIFSELPLHIKIDIIENGILIYSPNKYDLYEYFYFYRKLWADQKHRQYMSKEEFLSL